MRRLSCLIILILIFSSSAVLAGRIETVRESIEAEGAERIVVEGDFAAGEFRITAGKIDLAAILDISYDPRRVEYVADYTVKRGRGYLYLESILRRKSNIDTEDNVWDIQLSSEIPATIDLDIGACEADFDLGGIPLENLNLDIGAASGLIDFSSVNPVRLDEISIDAGASELEMTNIGNANFDHFNFDGGVGSFKLDFRGQYNGESTIELDIGLCSADIILPRDVAIRVETDGDCWLSSVEFHNEDLDEVDDDVYESPGFKDADTRIILELSVGLGSIDLYWNK